MAGPVAFKIRVQALAKAYGEGAGSHLALRDFSLDVAEGEFVCLLGPSGCGKTTALRIMAGLEQASAGSVVTTPPAAGQPANSMVFQEHGLFPWMTAVQNAAYGLEMRGVGRREREARAMAFLGRIGLARFRDHYPHQLSGGMRQRVSLARAFVNDPDILLMDEPFAALDAQTKLVLQEELLALWEAERKTVVFVTHGIDEALALGDRIVVMTGAPGRIKQVVPVPFARPRDPAALRANPEFGRLSLEIWHLIEREAHAA